MYMCICVYVYMFIFIDVCIRMYGVNRAYITFMGLRSSDVSGEVIAYLEVH